jgi:spermidine synthase
VPDPSVAQPEAPPLEARALPTRLYAIFFLSGAAGLMYEVIWLRHAGLHLGNTSAAIGTVVATFLGGLALGGALGGRWMDRALATRNAGFALAAYAVLEIGIGLYALLLEPALSTLTPLLGGLYRSGGEGTAFNIARALLCALLLLPPTVAMGATLPILARYAAACADDAAAATGGLYAVNTFGAVVGSFAAGWALIPALGLLGATALAVALNVAVAAGSWELSRRPLPPAAAPPQMPPPAAPRWIFPAYAASGFAALVYEVAWTRGLILSFGSSVYAFSLTLGCFILGLALGGAVASRAGPRVRDVVLAFAVLQIAVAVVGAVTSPALDRLPAMMMSITGTATRFARLLAAQVAIASLVVTLPALALGAMFPLLVRLAMGARESSGAAVGRLCAWNTAGNIAGTLCASFAILPLIGIHGAIMTASAINLLVAAGALAARARGRRPVGALVPLAIAPLLALLPAWRLEDVATTPAVYSKSFLSESEYRQRPVREILRDTEIIFSRWDHTGLVTVHKRDQQITLRVNGKADASSDGDMLTQILTAHLGMMAHPEPRDVLVVGLGSSSTAAAALKHPEARVDVVEISPAVAAAAREVFGPHLDHPLNNPRLRLYIGDGRAHVRFTDRRYDVIAAEPSNLWIGGTAALFTRESFQTYRDRLKPGGVLCQWLHAYKLPQSDFAAVLATFAAVFPDATLWEVSIGGDYLLLGARDRPLDVGTLRRRHAIPAVGEHLKRWGLLRFESLLRCFAADAEGIALASKGAELITDDYCHVEYSAPRGLIEEETHLSLACLEAARARQALPLKDAEGIEDCREGRRRLAAVMFASKKATAEGDTDGHLRALSMLREAMPHGSFDPGLNSVVGGVAHAAILQALELLKRGRREDARWILMAVPAESPMWYRRARYELQRLGPN